MYTTKQQKIRRTYPSIVEGEKVAKFLTQSAKIKFLLGAVSTECGHADGYSVHV